MTEKAMKNTQPDRDKTTNAPKTKETVSDAERVGGAGRGARQKPGERGGPEGPEPTRYGDWETGGRCTDF